MEANILKSILFDEHHHWDRFVEKNRRKFRPVVLKEVEKFRTCGSYEKGFKLYVCESCHEIKKLPYRCKGRFCTTCSCGETEEWSRVLQEDVFRVNHRHVIFTIDEGLRNIFLKHRNLLKPLMDEAARLIKDFFEKKKRLTPGIIMGLHTFGSKLNFNPHVNMLVTMGGMKENGEWESYDYLPFTILRKQWQTIVLKLIRKHVSAIEKKVIQPLLQKAYSANGDGFYIYAPKQKGNVKEQLKYIGRYMKRPAIGLNRIKSYDGETVTFSYKDKNDGKEKTLTVSVEEFIGCLIRHIPDEGFKTIRHYGVYSRRIKALCKRLVTEWQKTARKWIVKAKRNISSRNWRQRMKDAFKKDPLICPKCENYFEYKGEVCEEDGQLKIKVALCRTTRKYLEWFLQNASIKTT